MIRNSVRLAAVALVFAASAAQAQSPVSFGIAGGLTMPTGALGDGVESGYNLKGVVGLDLPAMPVSWRADLSYQSFSAKEGDGSLSVLGLDANAVYKFPGVALRPYAIGGLGMYRGTNDDGTNETTSTEFGINVGGGVSFSLAGMSTFVEARYTHIMTEIEATKIIPISFGIMF